MEMSTHNKGKYSIKCDHSLCYLKKFKGHSQDTELKNPVILFLRFRVRFI